MRSVGTLLGSKVRERVAEVAGQSPSSPKTSERKDQLAQEAGNVKIRVAGL